MVMNQDTIARFGELEQKVDANTAITLELKDDVAGVKEALRAHRVATQPVVDAIEAARPGLKVIGQIGTAAGAFLTVVKSFGLPFIGVAAFVWAIFHGETLGDAIAAFIKGITGKS